MKKSLALVLGLLLFGCAHTGDVTEVEQETPQEVVEQTPQFTEEEQSVADYLQKAEDAKMELEELLELQKMEEEMSDESDNEEVSLLDFLIPTAHADEEADEDEIEVETEDEVEEETDTEDEDEMDEEDETPAETADISTLVQEIEANLILAAQAAEDLEDAEAAEEALSEVQDVTETIAEDLSEVEDVDSSISNAAVVLTSHAQALNGKREIAHARIIKKLREAGMTDEEIDAIKLERQSRREAWKAERASIKADLEAGNLTREEALKMRHGARTAFHQAQAEGRYEVLKKVNPEKAEAWKAKKDNRMKARQEHFEMRMDNRTERKAMREEVKAKVEAGEITREEAREEMHEAKKEMREEMIEHKYEAMKEHNPERAEKMMEKAEERMEKMEERHEERKEMREERREERKKRNQ